MTDRAFEAAAKKSCFRAVLGFWLGLQGFGFAPWQERSAVYAGYRFAQYNPEQLLNLEPHPTARTLNPKPYILSPKS